jgi:prepilin-type N-terminal cleavage/methylation domain-containing protein
VESRERGFTLVEVVIGVAIIATTAAAGIAISLASRPAAVSAAAARFDALLDAARTEARAFDSGVTIAFTAPNANPAIDGFQARLYRNRPSTGTLVALNFAEIDAAVSLREREILGTPGFALTIHHDGRVSGVTGYTPVGQSSLPEVTCPASGSYHFVFSAAGGQADRYVPCRITLAVSGPIAYATIPPGGTSSPPPANGCGGGPCSSAPPVQTSTCPPNSFLNGDGCIDSPLVVTPSSLLFLHPNSPTQLIKVTENSYAGPIQIASTSCNRSALTLEGGGNGPGTFFSAASMQPGICNFTVADNHGGSKNVLVTAYDVLTSSPSSLVFPSPSAPAQLITAHEGYYPGVISTDLTTPSADGLPGCAPYAAIDSKGRSTDSSWNAVFTVSPQLQVANRCEVTLRDDHGGMIQVPVHILNPMTICPDGTIVTPGTPCSVQVASSSVTITFSMGCKRSASGQWSPGIDTLTVFNPNRQSYYLSPTRPQIFVSLTTMTLPNTQAVTFNISAPPGSTAVLAVSASGTQLYTAANAFPVIGWWNGNVWTPPYSGTFYVGYLQDYAAPDCNGDGSGGSGQQGVVNVYNGSFSFSARQQ